MTGSAVCLRGRRCEFTAQLRLLLVEPPARGREWGSAGQRVRRVRCPIGLHQIMLWTQNVQLEARRLYQRAGFKLDRNEPHHSFGCDLVGEYWSRDLHSS